MIIQTESSTLELIRGDCLEAMAEIPDASVDLILCDLPYGITNAAWDRVIPYGPLWEQYNRILKLHGAAVLFSMQPFTAKLIQSNQNAYRYSWYWLKRQTTGFTYARYQPMRKVEEICVFYRKAPTYNPQGLVPIPPVMRRGSAKKHSDLYGEGLNRDYTPKFRNWPVNVLDYASERGYHPTQKPVPLLEYLIRTYTNDGGVILDNAMGSGSTGAAVMRVGGRRRFIGIELSEKYFEIACRRLEAQSTMGQRKG